MVLKGPKPSSDTALKGPKPSSDTALKGPNPSNPGSSLRDPGGHLNYYGPEGAELIKNYGDSVLQEICLINIHMFCNKQAPQFILKRNPSVMLLLVPDIFRDIVYCVNAVT